MSKLAPKWRGPCFLTEVRGPGTFIVFDFSCLRSVKVAAKDPIPFVSDHAKIADFAFSSSQHDPQEEAVHWIPLALPANLVPEGMMIAGPTREYQTYPPVIFIQHPIVPLVPPQVPDELPPARLSPIPTQLDLRSKLTHLRSQRILPGDRYTEGSIPLLLLDRAEGPQPGEDEVDPGKDREIGSILSFPSLSPQQSQRSSLADVPVVDEDAPQGRLGPGRT